MDIARPDLIRQKRRRRWISFIIGAAILLAITLGLSRLEPAAPSVDSATILKDTVKRGPLQLDVHGHGLLVPEEIIWITAATAGRVEQILLLPGVRVGTNTVLVELSNPELVQSAFEAEAAVQSALAQIEKLKVQLESDQLALEASVATLKSEWALAKIEAEAEEVLQIEGLIPALTAKRSRARAEQLEARLHLEDRRLVISDRSAQAQIRAQESDLEKLRKQDQLKRRQVESLRVRAGFAGVLQRLGDDRPLQVGQQLAPGANLARIANPLKLKAEIRIAETQAKDIQHGQAALVDTRNGLVPGRVVRIDPAVVNGTVTVDLALEGALPKGARPDLSVDATITLARLDDVLYVGRPVNSMSQGQAALFRVVENGRGAQRVPVELGRPTVRFVQVVSGLQEGDQIIVSDMSQWDSHDRVKLN